MTFVKLKKHKFHKHVFKMCHIIVIAQGVVISRNLKISN